VGKYAGKGGNMRTINRYGKYAIVEDDYVLRPGEGEIVPPRQYFDRLEEEKDWEDYPAPSKVEPEPEPADHRAPEERYIVTYRSQEVLDFLFCFLDMCGGIPINSSPSAKDVEGKIVIGPCPEGAKPEKRLALRGEGVADVESATYKQLVRAGARLAEIAK